MARRPIAGLILSLPLALTAVGTARGQGAATGRSGMTEFEFLDYAFYQNSAWKALGMGDANRAEYLLGKAIELARIEEATDVRLMARCYSDLALVLHIQGRDAEAEPLARWALAARERAHGADSIAVGRTLYTLGSIETSLGRLDEAESSFGRLVSLSQNATGPASDATADALVDLAGVLVRRRGLGRARGFYNRAIAAYRVRGDDHPGLVAALDGLATIDLLEGKADDAGADLDAALAILDADRFADPKFLAATLRRRAEIRRKANRVAEADSDEAGARAAEARKKVYPPLPSAMQPVADNPHGPYLGSTRRRPVGP